MTQDDNGPESGSQRPAPVTFGSARAGRVERSDAARNRQRVLAAARDLFRARGVEAVTMDDIAAAAGVGKGTLYRRFGDKAGLAEALLDRREADLQEQILTGPPPLGPGAGPGERLGAFLDAYLDLVDADLGLLVMAEKGAGRLHSGAYAFWRAHVAGLLRTGGAGIDPEVGAHLLLAGVAADLYDHLRYGLGRSRADIATAVEALATALLPPAERAGEAGAGPISG
jgi:AcrR family transcriptional regulator